ncbi:MAG: response regulator [Thermodesulfobacteriota bacterium]|nr:response regulator [Thermodesulfobacteriota bacterium]
MKSFYDAINTEQEKKGETKGKTTMAHRQTENLGQFHGNGESILIVDDEVILQKIGTQILTLLGYKVHALASGKEAVAYLKNHSVDLVLLDMLLTPDMNGLETYKQILQISPQQKAIVISGYSQNDDINKTLALGAGAFLKKPYDMIQLSKAVFQELKKDK